MSDALALPPRPDLEQYKKLAKDFRRASRSTDPKAIRNRTVRWVETLARLRGQDITPETRAEIREDMERVERQWRRLRRSAEPGHALRLSDAQLFVARCHGFPSWPAFVEHIESLIRVDSPVAKFELAADAIIGGEIETLRSVLSQDPDLVRSRSTREHRSTLLHYVSANGIEDFRQKTPANIVEIANVLLDAGSEVDAESEAYGGGCTTLGLLATSIHPAEAGVQIPLLQTLLDHGARFDRPCAGRGHTIVTACLANGQPEAAEFFVNLGLPLDLENAAALGRLAVVETCFDEVGLPRDTDRKRLESAFFYACVYGRTEVAAFLLDKGIDPSLRNAAGETGLHMAAYGTHIDVANLLLDRGAPVDAKDEHFSATALDVALSTWHRTRNPAQRESSYAFIALLARRGAELDPEHWRNEDGPGMIETIRSDPHMVSALRGEILAQ